MNYLATTGDQAVTAAQDLIELTAPADAVLKIQEITVTQISDAGDAESEQLHIALKRASGSFTAGSGGTTIVPAPQEFGGAASGSTCDRNNTTQAAAGSGALTIFHEEGFNVMAGLKIVYPFGQEPVISPSQAFVLGLETAPADSVTVIASVRFEEIGG